MEQFIACTAVSSAYFSQCVNLMGSVFFHDSQRLTKFIVYNLGMTETQLSFLETLDRVQVKNIEPFCYHYLAWFAWKPWVINDCLVNDSNGLPVIYMDSGMQAQKSLNPILEIIRKLGYFYIDTFPHKNRDYTTKFLYEHLGLAKDSDETVSLMAGIQGYQPGSAACQVLRHALEIVQNERLIRPSSDCPNNRHDQPVFSLLLRYFYKDLWVMPFQDNPIVAWELDDPGRIRDSCIWLCRSRGIGGHDSHLILKPSVSVNSKNHDSHQQAKYVF